MFIEKPEVMNQGSHFKLTTLFGVNSLIFILYVKFFRTSSEVVEEWRNMNKIKHLQRQNVWYQVLDGFILFFGDVWLTK